MLSDANHTGKRSLCYPSRAAEFVERKRPKIQAKRLIVRSSRAQHLFYIRPTFPLPFYVDLYLIWLTLSILSLCFYV